MNCATECPVPGSCCRGFYLYSPDSLRPIEDILEERGWDYLIIIGEGENGTKVVSCSRLGPDGLCLGYENRPQFCADFQPGTSPMCATFIGPPCKGDRTRRDIIKEREKNQ